jgi:GT2 family glycosyltransferase
MTASRAGTAGLLSKGAVNRERKPSPAGHGDASSREIVLAIHHGGPRLAPLWACPPPGTLLQEPSGRVVREAEMFCPPFEERSHGTRYTRNDESAPRSPRPCRGERDRPGREVDRCTTNHGLSPSDRRSRRPRPSSAMTLVSVLVPTHQDMHLLERSLPAFLRRRPNELEVIIINNDPSQNVRDWAQSRLEREVTVLEMGYPSGFARAVNAGVSASSGEYVMFCNADLFVSESYVDEMLSFFEAHPRAGCAAGKLLRYELDADRETDVIDTAGLVMHRNRRATVRGEGLKDSGQLERIEEVFAVDGAGLFARRSALESIRIGDEYFDNSFFMYKEDWDLCWRLRLAGWECWYVPSAVAFHGRTSRGLGEKSYLSSVIEFHRNERAKPRFVRMHSMKNQWAMLLKNEDGYSFIRDLPFILARESLVLAYNLVFSPRALIAIPRFLKLVPETLQKRRAIKGRQVMSPSAMRPWLAGDRSSSRSSR